MKTRNLSLAAALCGTLGLMAQSKQISLGVDLGVPTSGFTKEYFLIVGPSAGFELPVGDKLGITLDVSYTMLLPKSDFTDEVSSASIIPAQAGLKYYFQESQKGFYGHAQIGIHSLTENFKAQPEFGVDAESATDTQLSYAIGLGYQLSKLDFGLRYQMIATGEEGGDANSYLGLRIAYLLPIGK